jgi:hypothetical protein
MQQATSASTASSCTLLPTIHPGGVFADEFPVPSTVYYSGDRRP